MRVPQTSEATDTEDISTSQLTGGAEIEHAEISLNERVEITQVVTCPLFAREKPSLWDTAAPKRGEE